MIDRNGAVLDACGAGGFGNLAAGSLVRRLALGAVVDQECHPLRGRFGKFAGRDLRAGQEAVRQGPEIAHFADPLAWRARRLRLIMLSPSTATEKPIAT